MSNVQTREVVPSHIGFVLAQRGITLPWIEGRQYRGIDRGLPVPDPLKVDVNERKVWNEYLDAQDNGELGRDRLKAERLGGDFEMLGIASEVIYGDIIEHPFDVVGPSGEDDEQRKRQFAWFVRRSSGIMPAPPDFVSIGLDVSEPFPSFHSPIIQPGPGLAHDAAFTLHLNGFGLIEDVKYATELMNAANLTGYRFSMFCVIRILVPRSAV